MAITDVTSNSGGTTGTSSSVTVTYGTTPTSGNLMVVYFWTRDDQTNVPSGWTRAAQCGGYDNFSVFWKEAGGSEGSSVTVTTSGADYAAWAYYELSGVDMTTPVRAWAGYDFEKVDSQASEWQGQASMQTGSHVKSGDLAIAAIGSRGMMTGESVDSGFTLDENASSNGGGSGSEIYTAKKSITADGVVQVRFTETASLRDRGLLVVWAEDGTAHHTGITLVQSRYTSQNGSDNTPMGHWLDTPKEGNLLVWMVSSGSTGTYTAPTGWSSVPNDGSTYTGGSNAVAVFYKIAGASETRVDLTYTVPNTNQNVGWMAEFAAPNGWPATPYDVRIDSQGGSDTVTTVSGGTTGTPTGSQGVSVSFGRFRDLTSSETANVSVNESYHYHEYGNTSWQNPGSSSLEGIAAYKEVTAAVAQSPDFSWTNTSDDARAATVVFLATSFSVGALVKAYNGTSWATGTPKVWNGSAWVSGTWKTYDASDWT